MADENGLSDIGWTMHRHLAGENTGNIAPVEAPNANRQRANLDDLKARWAATIVGAWQRSDGSTKAHPEL